MRRHCREKHPQHLLAVKKYLRKPDDLAVTDEEFAFIKRMVKNNILHDITRSHKKPEVFAIVAGIREPLRSQSLQAAVKKYHFDVEEIRDSSKNKTALTIQKFRHLNLNLRERKVHFELKVKNPVSEQDKSKLKAMYNNKTIQMLAVQIVRHMMTRGMCATEPVVDDNDGILPEGFNIRAHGGLYKLSFDRKLDHKKGFYCIHYPNLDNALDNINLVALLANVRYKASKKQRQDRYGEFNQKSEKLETEFAKVWAVAQQKYTKAFKVYTATPLYRHASYTFKKDETCKANFKSFQYYWKYLLTLLNEQNGRCAVSKFPMTIESGPWLMSPDAIDPKLGHVRGNLRLVCVCNNPVDHSKQNTNSNDAATSLTPEIHNKYWGIKK